MSAEEGTCRHCRHFFAFTMPECGPPTKQVPTGEGECRRNAPFFPHEGRKGVFAGMTADGWCGEFEVPLAQQRAWASAHSGGFRY